MASRDRISGPGFLFAKIAAAQSRDRMTSTFATTATFIIDSTIGARHRWPVHEAEAESHRSE